MRREPVDTRPKRCQGIVVGGLDHQLLLALRCPGGMTSDQVYARFKNSPSGALFRLKAAGLVEMPGLGTKAKQIRLTDKGKELIAPDGPLSRRQSLITYCAL